jgi:ribosomal protein S8
LHKQNSRIQFTANKIKGKIAEEIAKQDYINNGFEIQETGIGSDFIAIKKLENIAYKEYVDVKSGNAKLTKKQKQTKNLLRKENIIYSIYRVSNEHLESQIKTNEGLQHLCQGLGFDISKFTGVFIVQDPASCPNCELTLGGLQEILTNFGLRNMGDGTVRVQSWCRKCRNYSSRGIK